MSTKRIFILGAGFSKQAGMPLATELTSLNLEKFKEHQQGDMLSWYEWLKQRLDWLGHTINIEQVFDLARFDVEGWRMNQHISTLGRNAGDTSWNKAESIESWLSWMEYDLANVVWHKQKQAEQKLEAISRFSRNLQSEDMVLTFNYDTLLESSLSGEKIDWWYGFEREVKKIGIMILKMHGSINWRIAGRETSSNSELLFRKEDINVTEHGAPVPEEPEYNYELARVPDGKVDGFIRERDLQWAELYYYAGIAGLGAHKALHLLPGSGEVWINAMKALREAQQIYVIGFSLSPFDTMARLRFAGTMLKRAENGNLPRGITLVDPYACELKANFRSVFGSDPAIRAVERRAEDVDWRELLGG